MTVNIQSLLQQIRSARQARQNEKAVDTLRHILGRQFPIGPFADELISHALELADEDAAMEIAMARAHLNPRDPRPKLVLAERLSRVGRSNDALRLVKDIAAGSPPNPAIDYFLGVYSGHVGEIEDAKRHFRSALNRKPDFGDAWALFGASGGVESEDEATLKDLVEKKSPHAMPGAAYALGGYYHAKKDYKAAVSAWQAANAAERVRRPFNLQGELNAMKDICLADKRVIDALPAAMPSDAPTPIFIVGAPRSGTSLTEQVIALGEGVTPLGETMLSRLATWSLGNLGQGDMAAAGAFEPGRIDWQRMGQVYRTLARNRAPETRYVTDKGAILHLFVGVLARALLDAKFVWVKRGPRDIALSGYRAYLGDGNRWRQDFSDAAAYLKGYIELMEYWVAALPGRIHVLEYERLASEPQAETEKLMAYLSLVAPNMQTADFGRSNVPTASFVQIRSKISPASVGGWRAYEDVIGPAFS